MREKKDNLVYVKHINDAINKITAFTSQKTYEEFIQSEWDQAAIMRYFEIIGEASIKIDTDFKEQYKEIEWRDMSDFRNFLIHDYMDVDLKIVWNSMTFDIPRLKEKIEKILFTS